MAVISLDVDLLDRAERRDLPTAHQELIARARAAIQGQVSSKTTQGGQGSSNFRIISNLNTSI